MSFGLGAGLLASCVTTSSGSREIVERSKASPPPWSTLAPGQLHEANGFLELTYMQADLKDLPLGLKVTQLGGLRAGRSALASRLAARLTDYAQSHGLMLKPAVAGELGRAADAAATDVHGRYAKVADIYFEKLADPDVSSDEGIYRIYVLITFPEARTSEALGDLGGRLLRSRDSTLRQLGTAAQTLARTPAQPIGH